MPKRKKIKKENKKIEQLKGMRENAQAIALIGLIILVTAYIYETIICGDSSLGMNIYYKLFASLVLYIGIVLDLALLEKKPMKTALLFVKKKSSYLVCIIVLFFASAVFGFVESGRLTFLDDLLHSIIQATNSLDPLQLTAYIFLNNTLASLVGFLGGFLLGLIPITTTIGNGLVLGFVMSKAGLAQSWRIVPHGIFELPAVFISLALGLNVGKNILKNYFVHYKKNNMILFIAPFILFGIASIWALVALTVPASVIPTNGLAPAFQEGSLLRFSLIVSPLLFSVILFSLLILCTCALDAKLRKVQVEFLRENVYKSAIVFLFIVIPLLIIAAIIEGTLIYFTR